MEMGFYRHRFLLVCIFFLITRITSVGGDSVEFNSYQQDLRSASYISMDTTYIDTNNLDISFSFRSLSTDSPLLYMGGDNRQYVILELNSNFTSGKIYFKIKVIKGPVSSGYTTIERDPDTEWNNVSLSLNTTHFSVRFNHEEVNETLINPIRLSGRLYFGSPRPLDLEHIMNNIYSGCLRDVIVNKIRVLEVFRSGDPTYRFDGNIRQGCSLPTETVTFSGMDSYVWYNLSAPSDGLTTLTTNFKTFDLNFGLVVLDFGENGNISVNILGSTVLRIQQWRYGTTQQQQFTIAENLSDGKLKTLTLSLNETNMELKLNSFRVDRTVFTGPRWSDLTQRYYLYLGGFPGSPGFEGCMKGVTLKSGYESISNLEAPDHRSVGASFGMCKVYDRCDPNPCRSGRCTRLRGNFICDCTNTGYTGAVCRTPLYPQSCSFVTFPPGYTNVQTTIDVDGSGPLLPTDVICSNQDEYTVTVRSGMNTTYALVDGFQEPGSYVSNINYFNIAEKELVGIIDQSTSCRQFVEYRCQDSRLLLTPANSPVPYGYWVGRNGYSHFYWGGSDAETGGCFCKKSEACINGGTCNCNSGQLTSDKGEITQMEDLPVRQVHFGDTGTVVDSKSGQYNVGPLTCTGDAGLKNVVTFSRLNSTIELDYQLLSAPITIWFQFKTLKSRSTLLYAAGKYNNNYLVIRIEGPNQLFVRLMHDIPSRSLLWALPFQLNDDQWHSVYFEFNAKEAVINVDDMTTKVVVFDEWMERRNLMTDSPLILGANEDGSNQFLGCFRGLRINGGMVNLRQLVQEKQTKKGILEGCISPCYSNPCLNSGACINKYYATFMCDCERSAYSGCYCGKALGVSMASNTSVLFYRQRQFVPTPPKDIEFSLRSNREITRGSLMRVLSQTSEFLSILIISGQLKIELNYGSGFASVVNPVSIGDGRSHDIKVTVDNVNSQVILLVDQTESFLSFPLRDTTFNAVSRISIGSSDINEPGLAGCLFGVRYNDFPLLKLVLSEPQPSYIVKSGELVTSNCMVPESMPQLTTPPNGPMTYGPEGRMPAYIESVTTINEADGKVRPALEVYAGEITHLSCNGKGEPAPVYEWTLNGNYLPCPHLVDEGQVLLLPEEMLEGVYQCSAKNKWGMSQSDFISVDSAEVGTAPQMQSETQIIREGSYVRLFCNNTVLSKPKAEIFWLDQFLSERIFQAPTGDLNFLWVKPEDSNTYTCGVRNPTLNLYRTIRSITLIVQPGETPFLSQPSLVFSDGPREAVKLGDKANFECVVTGDPVPRQRWEYPNFNGDLGSITKDPYGRILSIAEVTEQHQGTYQCLLGNRPIQNFTLTVTSKPIWEEPLGEKLVYANTDIKLRCLSRSLPGDVPPRRPQWFVNGTELVNLNQLPDPNRYIFNSDRTVLEVKRVRKEDIQTFQCNVSNNVGYSYSAGYLNVLDPMFVVKKPANLNIVKGNMAVFEVEVRADPTAEIYFTWQRNQMDVIPFFQKNLRRTELQKTVALENTQMSSRFVINTEHIHEEDLVHFEGTYMCAVSDGVTQEMTEVTLTISSASAVSLSENDKLGIIIGCVCGAVLILVLIILFCCLRRNKKVKQADITSYKNPSFTH